MARRMINIPSDRNGTRAHFFHRAAIRRNCVSGARDGNAMSVRDPYAICACAI